MGRIVRVLVGSFALVAIAAPVLACINDREVQRAEREFKSRYEGTPPAAEGEPELNLTSVGLTALGAAMLLGAAVRVRRPGSVTE